MNYQDAALDDYPLPSRLQRRDRRDRWHHDATCAACGEGFVVTAGEAEFSSASSIGVPLPTCCRWCRPTRRQALAEGLAR